MDLIIEKIDRYLNEGVSWIIPKIEIIELFMDMCPKDHYLTNKEENRAENALFKILEKLEGKLTNIYKKHKDKGVRSAEFYGAMKKQTKRVITSFIKEYSNKKGMVNQDLVNLLKDKENDFFREEFEDMIIDSLTELE